MIGAAVRTLLETGRAQDVKYSSPMRW